MNRLILLRLSQHRIFHNCGYARSDDFEPIIDEILKQEAQTVQTLTENPQAINYLVGKVMKKTNGKADPTTTLKLLREKTS